MLLDYWIMCGSEMPYKWYRYWWTCSSMREMATIMLVPECHISPLNFVISVSKVGDRGSLTWLKRSGSQYLVPSIWEVVQGKRAVYTVVAWMGFHWESLVPMALSVLNGTLPCQPGYFTDFPPSFNVALGSQNFGGTNPCLCQSSLKWRMRRPFLF